MNDPSRVRRRRAMPNHVGEPDADGAQNAGVGMHEHLPNAQLACDGAGMLRRRRPKRHEQIVRRVRALRHGHQPNRRRHVRIRNPQQPRRQLLQRIRTGRFSGQLFNRSSAAPRSSGNGNRSATIRPKTRLQSVTVSGPPRP